MKQLTKNFSLEEFACKDKSSFPGPVLVNITELANNLQVLRDYLGVTISITNGYRSVKHNKSIGGVENSQHVLGRASDIKAKGKTPKEVAIAIEFLIASGKMKQGGIGIYKTFTHYDIRGTKARW